MANFLSLSEWKTQTAGGVCSDPLVKYFTTDEVKAVGDPTERVVQFTISTASVDRDRDVINPKGWDLTNYLKGGPGPVLLAHDYRSLPIGKALRVWVEGDALKSAAQICTAEEHPLGEYVYRQLLGGFLKSASVGFRPVEFAYDAERDGYNFSKQELLEYSIVAVPSQPDAYVYAKSIGLDMTPLKVWAEEFLDTVHEEKGLWLPRSQVEKVFSLLETKTIDIPDMTVMGGSPEVATEGASVEIPAEDIVKSATEEPLNAVTKSGRTISATHEAMLKQAVDCVQKVLASCAPSDEPMRMLADETEAETKAVTDPNLPVTFDVDPQLIVDTIKSQLQEFITATTGRVF